MKKILWAILSIILSISIYSCKQELNYRAPSGTDESKPAAILNPQVENLNGAARISYTVPKDKNLLYIKAVYTLSNGQRAEAQSTYYTNSIFLDGFADTELHEVALYAVSRNNTESDPVTVTVKPLEAPIWQVFKSLNMETAFGGYNLKAKNPSKSDVSILILKKNAVGEWETDNDKSIHTNADSIVSTIRALDTVAYTFPILVQDKWGNKTDTLFKTIRPLYEAEFPKTNFKALVLPGDAPQREGGVRLEYAWDNLLGTNTSFTDQNAISGPHMVTIDLGLTGKLSRIWIRTYPEGSRYYFLSTMKRFEIYGSVSPNLDGDLDDSWILLGSYEVVKPSGLPYGTDNDLDQSTAAAGFNWDIDLNAPKVRYIRIRCLENFAGGTAQNINELSVFGDYR